MLNFCNMIQQMNSWTCFRHICFYYISSNKLESVLLLKPLLKIFSKIFILQVLYQVILRHQFEIIFLILDSFLSSPPLKSNIYETDWKKFDQEMFILDCFAVDWADIMQSEKKSVDSYLNVLSKNSMQSLVNIFH